MRHPDGIARINGTFYRWPYTVLLAVIALVLVGNALGAQPMISGEKALEEMFKRWTNVQRFASSGARVTYLSSDLIEKWGEVETDALAKKRIAALAETVRTESLRVYVVRISLHDYSQYSIGPVRERVFLTGSGERQMRFQPVLYTGNLDETLTSGSDERPRVYYGFIAFRGDVEKLGTETVHVRIVRPATSRWDQGSSHDLQFTFLPNGAPPEYRYEPRWFSSVDISDVLNLLSVALEVVALVAK